MFLAVTEDVHWYDGVAYPFSISNWQSKLFRGLFRFTTLSEQVCKEALLSGKEFLPLAETIIKTILSHNNTAEYYLNEINTVMSSLSQHLLDYSLRKPDPQLREKVSNGRFGDNFKDILLVKHIPLNKDFMNLTKRIDV